MSLTVCPWSPEYAYGAIEVVRSVFEEYAFTWAPSDYHADLYDVPAAYLNQGHQFFVAIVENVVVGTAALAIHEPIAGSIGSTTIIDGKIRAAETDCALNRLYVSPTNRRSGAGSALMLRIKTEAQKRNRTAMEIWSDKRFLDAHRLYERFGARQIGERICDDPDESPEWGLIVDLRP